MTELQEHLLITKGPRTGEKIPLSASPFIIGREASIEVLVNLESISRKHLRVSKGDLGYIIEDLNSSNGTYVNDVLIEKPYQIKDGDRIALGPDFEMRAVIPVVQQGDATAFMPSPAGTDKTMVAAAPPPAPAIPPSLIIHESGKEPRVFTLTMERLRIGRKEDNDIVLDNRFVSRYHAELEKRGQDYYIIPVPSVSNPLLLDGRPVMEATRLHHGTKIRFGGFSAGEIVALDYLSPDSELASHHKIR